MFNEDLRQDKIATIQKNLTKGVGFFRSKICQELGLRYAPEIRFYHDNSKDVRKELEEEGAIEGLTGFEYDPNNYKAYFKELSHFLQLSKIELEKYIDENVKDQEEADKIRELHKNK